ncbi:TPA: hypothetical protein SL662_004953 [Pseudomonas aeruginosa]|nr:hypothetical protein [Pseudomonas aeruginosa]HEJ5194861.1 hypothetical protein [Pseudomonas aeruginosa]
MTESKICTCPSGDGSLRWPCPAHPAVEQAGGDERAAFELFVRKHCGMPAHIAVNWDAKFTNDAWEGWKARAALAQPSPVPELERPATFSVPSCENSYGFGYVDGTCIQSLRGYRDHLETIVDALPEGELMTVAQHARIVGALRAENAKLSEALDRWPLIRDSLKLRLADALARVAELEKLSRAHDPLRIGLSAMLGSFKTATNPEQEGTLRMARQLLDATADARYGDFKNKAIVDRLIAGLRTPVAQAQQLHDLDKQCRDDVARALGLRPNQERGFAWSYLLASIKSCVKASEDSAQAQHSVPDGAADLCRFLAKLYCELDGLRYSTAKLPAEQIADALIFKWPVLQGTRNQLNIKRISEQPYDESKLHSAIAAMLAAAPSEKRSCEYAGCCSTAHPGTSLCIAHHSKKVQEQLLAAAPGKEGV